MGIRFHKTTLVLGLLLLAANGSSGEGGDSVSLQAAERLTLDGGAIQSPVSFFIMHGSPAKLMYPINQSAFKNVEAWQIQILDSDGRKVSFIQGIGAPSSPVIPWSGLSENGEPLPDGFYDAQLIWADADGPHKTPARKVSLLTPPSLRALFRFQLKLDYTSEGLVVRIPEIAVFNAGQSLVRAEALPALRAIADFLKSSPDNKVDVRGYTDTSGSLDGNMSLSQERALAVMRFLAGNDIDPQRLTYKGLGAEKPIASNSTAAGRAKNRRVEVVVLKTGA